MITRIIQPNYFIKFTEHYFEESEFMSGRPYGCDIKISYKDYQINISISITMMLCEWSGTRIPYKLIDVW